MRTEILLLLLGLTACGEGWTPPAASNAPQTPTHEEPSIERPAPIQWVERGTATLHANGLSDAVIVDVPAAQRHVALRVGPAQATPDSGLCYRVESVWLNDTPWVAASTPTARQPTCVDCAQPVRWGPDEGLFVFPDAAVAAGGRLRFQVAVRDCEVGIPASRARFPDMPAHVVIETAWSPAVAPTKRGRLGVRIGIASDSGLDRLDAIWQTAADTFERAGIDLVLEDQVHLPSAGPLDYGPGDWTAVEALQTQLLAAVADTPSDQRFVPVLIVPCLRAQHATDGLTRYPHGQTSRIPGGLGSRAAPSVVLVSTGRCGSEDAGWTPERGGIVFAHELGHYLGLFHSDHAAGRVQAEQTDGLMHSAVLETADAQAEFSSEQAAIMRSHPDVFFDE